MDSKLLTNRLIEAEEGYIFNCNNCNHKFSYVYSFYPIPRLSDFYICSNCNSMLPVKNLKKTRTTNCIYSCWLKIFKY